MVLSHLCILTYLYLNLENTIYVEMRHPLRCHRIQQRVQCLSEENALRESRLVQCIVLVLQPRHNIPHHRKRD